MPRWRSLHSRIEGLEVRVPSSEASGIEEEERRERVREGLERIAYLRRSDSPEARGEVEAFRVALEHELAQRRGRVR